MITKFKIFEFNEKYFKKGDYVKEFDGDVILQVISASYKHDGVKYRVVDILNNNIYSFRHSDDVEPASKEEVDKYLMKKDIEKYNL